MKRQRKARSVRKTKQRKCGARVDPYIRYRRFLCEFCQTFLVKDLESLVASYSHAIRFRKKADELLRVPLRAWPSYYRMCILKDDLFISFRTSVFCFANMNNCTMEYKTELVGMDASNDHIYTVHKNASLAVRDSLFNIVNQWKLFDCLIPNALTLDGDRIVVTTRGTPSVLIYEKNSLLVHFWGENLWEPHEHLFISVVNGCLYVSSGGRIGVWNMLSGILHRWLNDNMRAPTCLIAHQSSLYVAHRQAISIFDADTHQPIYDLFLPDCDTPYVLVCYQDDLFVLAGVHVFRFQPIGRSDLQNSKKNLSN